MRALVRPFIYASFKKSITEVSGADNLPKRGPYIIAPNHVDYLDGQRIITAIYPHRDEYINFLAETNNYGWSGMIIKINYKDKAKTLEVVTKHLQRGEIICNFPEGRRNSSDILLPGKTGTVRMALAAHVPIIPLGMVGPSGRTYVESARAWVGGLAKYKVAIGKPLVYKKYFDQGDDQKQVTRLTEEVMKEIGKLCNKKTA